MDAQLVRAALVSAGLILLLILAAATSPRLDDARPAAASEIEEGKNR